MDKSLVGFFGNQKVKLSDIPNFDDKTMKKIFEGKEEQYTKDNKALIIYNAAVILHEIDLLDTNENEVNLGDSDLNDYFKDIIYERDNADFYTIFLSEGVEEELIKSYVYSSNDINEIIVKDLLGSKISLEFVSKIVNGAMLQASIILVINNELMNFKLLHVTLYKILEDNEIYPKDFYLNSLRDIYEIKNKRKDVNTYDFEKFIAQSTTFEEFVENLNEYVNLLDDNLLSTIIVNFFNKFDDDNFKNSLVISSIAGSWKTVSCLLKKHKYKYNVIRESIYAAAYNGKKRVVNIFYNLGHKFRETLWEILSQNIFTKEYTETIVDGILYQSKRDRKAYFGGKEIYDALANSIKNKNYDIFKFLIDQGRISQFKNKRTNKDEKGISIEKSFYEYNRLINMVNKNKKMITYINDKFKSNE